MDFIEEIQALSVRIRQNLEFVQTEEATKTALIMPFVRALGYNTEDPREVVPEFTADIGTKKGEKVDYAIMKDGKAVILIECKAAGTNLTDTEASQLFRYFSVSDARFGILTNGIVYRFYSDLDEINKMDIRPFLEIDMLEVDESLVDELRRFSKSAFQLDNNLEAAVELKYSREIKRLLAQQLREPSDEFVKLIVGQVYLGKMTKSVKERFSDITKQAFNQFINERVFDRLKSAMVTGQEEDMARANTTRIAEPLDEEETKSNVSDIVTTEDEIQGYFIVKSLLHGVVDVKRIVMRDMKNFCGVLLDDTLRKPVCRLWFNSSQKYIGLIDDEKKEERVPIQEPDDIYNYADRLRATVRNYEKPDAGSTIDSP